MIFVHYDDLLRDLPGEMRRLALGLDIEVPEHLWPTLVEAATFTSMSLRAEQLAPDSSGILKSPRAFFRRGVSGSGREVLSDAELAHYDDRVGHMAPSALLTWLHHRPETAAP
jgi:aryl sulfotransferase